MIRESMDFQGGSVATRENFRDRSSVNLPDFINFYQRYFKMKDTGRFASVRGSIYNIFIHILDVVDQNLRNIFIVFNIVKVDRFELCVN